MITPAPLQRDRVLLGVGCMMLATSLFPIMNGTVQVLSARYSSEQLVWARILVQVFFVLGFFAPRSGLALIKTRQPFWQFLRSCAQMSSTFCFFYGVKHLPLAKAASIGFLGPFIVALLAWPILGERITVRRLMAVIVAFFGVLVIIRPGSEVFHWASFYILGSTTFYALYQIFTRKVAGHDPPETSAFYGALVGSVVMTAALPYYWRTPIDWIDGALMASLGVIAGLGHYFVARAMTYAQANIIAPFGYWQLIGATLVGFLITGALPDIYTWIGAAIIICAGVYIALVETRNPPMGTPARL